jgi:hypothetical protein
MAPLMASGHRPYIPMPQGRGFTDATIKWAGIILVRTVLSRHEKKVDNDIFLVGSLGCVSLRIALQL